MYFIENQKKKKLLQKITFLINILTSLQILLIFSSLCFYFLINLYFKL